jgi:hypothetical protein
MFVFGRLGNGFSGILSLRTPLSSKCTFKRIQIITDHSGQDLLALGGHGIAAAKALISVVTRASSKARSRDSPME